jgi:hypothetical protein
VAITEDLRADLPLTRGDPRADEREPVPVRRVREHRPGDRRDGCGRGGGSAVRAFSYVRAEDASDAVAPFRPGTMYVGGGTNLVDLMRLGVAGPDHLVDVSHLPLD